VAELKQHSIEQRNFILGQSRWQSLNEEEHLPVIDSPVLLAGSTVVQGVGQMLVLAVGKNRW